MSKPSHKSSPKKSRGVQLPQRSNGRLRVAAILQAAADVIGAKGYEAATMAEIADRSSTKIGSLYRFFPNKECLAETMLASARANLHAEFDRFDEAVRGLSIDALVDHLETLLFKRLLTPALKKLLDASKDGSIQCDEFRDAVLGRVTQTLMIYRPKLREKSAADIALVILLNMKAAATHQEFFDSAPSILDEFRAMTRLYLESRLG